MCSSMLSPRGVLRKSHEDGGKEDKIGRRVGPARGCHLASNSNVVCCATLCRRCRDASPPALKRLIITLNAYASRHVILPKDLAKGLPKSRVLTEQEWRGLGVQQSRGWMHYAIHRRVKGQNNPKYAIPYMIHVFTERSRSIGWDGMDQIDLHAYVLDWTCLLLRRITFWGASGYAHEVHASLACCATTACNAPLPFAL